MGWVFFAGSGVGLALCAVFPFLLPYVLAGILIGVLPVLPAAAGRAGRRLGRTRGGGPAHPSRPLIAIASAVLTVALSIGMVGLVLSALSNLEFGSGSAGPERLSVRRAAMPVTYRGQGTYRDSPERLDIEDRLSIELKDIRAQAKAFRLLPRRGPSGRRDPPPPASATLQLERLIVAELAAQGWRLKGRTTADDVFARRRSVLLHSRSLPVDTGNQVPLPALPNSRSYTETPFFLFRTDRSQLLLTAPAHTFDSTRPASDRDEHLTGDLEDRRIPLAGASTVEIDVRSPWFRSGLTSTAAGLALSGSRALIGILIGILIMVLSEPVQNWLRRRLGIEKRN